MPGEEKHEYGKRLTCDVYRAIDQDPDMPYSFTCVTAKCRYTANYARDRKVLVNNRMKAYIQHMEELPSCTLTGDYFPKLQNFGWRNVSNVELDKVLACGPTKDPLFHRGTVLDREMKKKKDQNKKKA